MATARPASAATCASPCNPPCGRWSEKHEIHDCIYGENWRTGDERTWELLKRMPELKSDSDLGNGNKGFTIVVL